MYVAKQARNEETRQRNMRVRNCQRSDLVSLLGNCADTIEIYTGRSRFDCPTQSSRDPHAIPTRQIYKPRYARRAFGPPRFARNYNHLGHIHVERKFACSHARL